MTTYTDATPALYGDLIAPAAPSVLRWHFASVADAGAALPADTEALGRARRNAWHPTGIREEPETEFCGARHSATVRMIREGWPEGAERARKVRDGIIASAPVAPRMVRYDMAGAVPDVRRALAGNPMAMRRPAPAETRARPVLTILAPSACKWSVKAADMELAAAAVAAAIDTLEAGGYPCHVLSVTLSERDDRVAEIVTQVKAPEAPLSLADVAFACGHPAYFRRVMFYHLASDPRASFLGGNLGYPKAPKSNLDRHIFSLPALDDLAKWASANPRTCYLRILRHLAKLGCPGIPDNLPTE
jgi:hypothetical protein